MLERIGALSERHEALDGRVVVLEVIVFSLFRKLREVKIKP